MKKIGLMAVVILMAIGLALSVFAADIGPLKLLTTVGTTGAGSTIGLPKVYSSWACQADITGAPTAVTVSIEGNISGATYSTLQSHAFSADQLTATQALFTFDAPIRQVRGNLVTLTGGTSPKVSLICVGVE